MLSSVDKQRQKVFAVTLMLALCSGCVSPRRTYYALTKKVARVPTESMMPTIRPGNYVVIEPDYYSNNTAQRFELVAIKSQLDEKTESGEPAIWIERVIALGGDTVEIKDGKIYINQQLLHEPFATISDRSNFKPLLVPQGEYFLLGDNRPNSFDSRMWKRPTIDKSQLYGKVIEIYSE